MKSPTEFCLGQWLFCFDQSAVTLHWKKKASVTPPSPPFDLLLSTVFSLSYTSLTFSISRSEGSGKTLTKGRKYKGGEGGVPMPFSVKSLQNTMDSRASNHLSSRVLTR